MIRFIFFLTLNLGIFGASSLQTPNCTKVMDLITKDGYYAEEHKIPTEDGYILTAHRVSNCTNNTEVVLLLHGLFFSSADWLLLGPDNALPYLLADKCYDVWLINFRGNDESREHLYYDLNSPSDYSKYWNFSWHEMGINDLPATINYVLTITGKSSLRIVCHSQGCNAVFVAAIAYPNLADRITTVCALAPAAYLGNTSNHIVRMISLSEFALKAAPEGTTYHKFSLTDLKGVAATFCSNFPPKLCEIFLTFGFDLSQTNTSVISILPCHTPSGISTKQLIHFFQLINSGKFQHYDYGFWKNIEMYGSSLPPNYDLSQVKIPVSVYYGVNDKMVVPSDVRRTARELGNCTAIHFVPNLAHYDFLYGIKAKDVYNSVIPELEKYR